MLAPSGGGLILYQAYGNLYAMTGRKAHLLEDKQIPSVGVFDEIVLGETLIIPNEPNEENPVIPEPNHVEDAHDPNEMVDIPDNEELVEYDGDDEEDPEE
ncbi:hypothetical protein Tco_0576457 [Tanacetum coccineum]